MRMWFVIQVLKVLLLSLFRKKLTLVILLCVAPPIIIYSTITFLTNTIVIKSETLLIYSSSESVLISDKPLSGMCTVIRYGLASLILTNNTSLNTFLIAVGYLRNLSYVLNLEDLNSNCSHLSNIASIGSSLFKRLGNALQDTVNICIDGVCTTYCLAYTHLSYFEDALIIENIEGVENLNTSFLCIYASKDISKNILVGIVNEVSNFFNIYILIAIAGYIPVISFAVVKTLNMLGEELRVLMAEGTSISILSIVFTMAISILFGIISTYSVVLSYFIVYIGLYIFNALGISLLSLPQLDAKLLIPSLSITCISIPIGYIVFKLRGQHVIESS